MYDRMQELTVQQMEKIHDAAMDLLKNTGVAFNDEEGLDIFKSSGFRVEGSTVFFEEAQIQKALETAPKRFTWISISPICCCATNPSWAAPPPNRAHWKALKWQEFCSVEKTKLWIRRFPSP